MYCITFSCNTNDCSSNASIIYDSQTQTLRVTMTVIICYVLMRYWGWQLWKPPTVNHHKKFRYLQSVSRQVDFFAVVYRSQSSLGLTALPVFCPFSVFSSFALFCAIFFSCFALFVRPPNVLHPLWRWRPTKRIVCVLVLLQFEDLAEICNNSSFFMVTKNIFFW